ncbi:MAG: DUF2088 domain-containing protein [Planctomycetes bacterium]|nr:DUF2088 domain-containing protein [Planctomycetota bacterium]
MEDKKAKNKNTIKIPFENSFIELPIFSNAEVAELVLPYIEPLNDKQILHSIKNPVDNAPISEIAKDKSNVVIILENATRPLDTSFIASFVVDELGQAGIADENITFLFANGGHKDMEEYNYKGKLGSRFKNFRIINHDCEGELTNLGTTKLGSPISINPVLLEADLKIAIGTIEPHYGHGFSGGAKILFPGCAGLEWIFNNHSLKRGEFGVLDNQWRNDTEESAGKVDIDFLINAVLNYKQEIIGLYCGDWIKAHREGVSLSLKASITELPYKADFCIAGSSPFDLNFLQTLKSISATKTVIKEDGTYVILASCRQGLGNHRWLLDEKMLAERHKLNADYDSAMSEIIFSPHLTKDDLYSYYPTQIKLINDIDKLRQTVASLDEPGKKGVILPYSPITILR